MKMVASHHFTRINTLELKELIYEKIGQQRGETYFDQLKRFLSSNLSKAEFDKSCIETIGRENLPIHNRLIRSIIQNVSQAKTPPQKVEALGVKVSNGYSRNHLHSVYGDAFPYSPRKCRSPLSRDRKFRDRPSPLGPLGKSPSLTCEETVSRIQEQQGAAELQTISGKPPTGAASVEDGEEVEQCAVIPVSHRWSSITAPFGVSVNLGGARKVSHSDPYCQTSGELPDTRSLGRRLQKKLALEGVGITLDGANLLNNGLDVYLKNVISQCIGVARSRQSNGVRKMQPSNARMLDFRVAMESNPSILGEDWPMHLEKVCNYALQ
ncbi:uncharacterized protein LOC125219101 [Salvia hispanica]|uniref:uncharacterized protein LOC125219101 n=1 Tax=Salvia hispanica TaxID=49212 RepID=UPI00200950BE|nr:uncharacterized protein LOC125219101 [Salvia hispanica]XP_047976929.1 uncharacterized protein LOC125219101 [Salvia hispanica]XP_047976931.1 uncharacterized protein LOC125219101 [Salvia hispanica]XP_047976932.1 uncharacterized protein LOC125219101 [Salvia hispanica]